jgi:hypothetical protein
VSRPNFSVSRKPIEFDLGGEPFAAKPVVAPASLGEMLDAAEEVARIQTERALSQREQLDEALKIFDKAFRSVLVDEAVERFSSRLFSTTEPFDLGRELMPCLQWLIEEYTNRPTEPSPTSTRGPDDGGSSSTSGASAGASTPSTSQPTDSVTPSTPPSTT